MKKDNFINMRSIIHRRNAHLICKESSAIVIGGVGHGRVRKYGGLSALESFCRSHWFPDPLPDGVIWLNGNYDEKIFGEPILPTIFYDG